MGSRSGDGGSGGRAKAEVEEEAAAKMFYCYLLQENEVAVGKQVRENVRV